MGGKSLHPKPSGEGKQSILRRPDPLAADLDDAGAWRQLRDLVAEAPATLDADERLALQLAVTQDSLTSRDLIEQLGFDERRAQRVLKKLESAGLLQRIGKARATRYEVVRS